MEVRKLRIDVVSRTDTGGNVRPLGICLYNGQFLPVESVKDTQKAANRRIGCAGTMYRVIINHGVDDYRQHVLWREGDAWFVEERVDAAPK